MNEFYTLMGCLNTTSLELNYIISHYNKTQIKDMINRDLLLQEYFFNQIFNTQLCLNSRHSQPLSVFFPYLHRAKSRLLPNKEDVKLQRHMSTRSSFQLKTSTISSKSRVKTPSSQLRCFSSKPVQKDCIARTGPAECNASTGCTSEAPFHKTKWRSKSNLTVSQISTHRSSLKRSEPCSTRAAVTWV